MKHSLKSRPAGAAELHGEAYAKDYQKKDSRRITRLIPLIEKSNFGVLADIGCGTGMLLDAIGEKFTAYHGVDLSPDLLGYARRRRVPRSDLAPRGYCLVPYAPTKHL